MHGGTVGATTHPLSPARPASAALAGFIDTDEFIILRKDPSLPALLKHYEEYGGLALSWTVFGTSGHINRPPGGVLASYDKCTPRGAYLRVKTIVNTRFALASKDLHTFHYANGSYAGEKKHQWFSA